MKPQQFAQVAAEILKERGEKIGDYQDLYENLDVRLTLSFKDKLKPGQKFTAADAAKFHIENKCARIDCGLPNPDNNLDLGNYSFIHGGLTDEKF